MVHMDLPYCVKSRFNAYVVNVYEITRTAARRVRVAELRACGAVLSLQLAGARLLLGYRGGIAAHALPDPRPINDTHLLIFTATHIDVYDIETGDWVQTMNIHPRASDPPLSVDTSLWGNKRRFSVREQSHQAIEAHNRLKAVASNISSYELRALVTYGSRRRDPMYSSRESSKRTSPLTISHGTGSYNGSWRSAGRRDGPCEAPASPPRMERSLGGGSQGSGSLLERSITPLSWHGARRWSSFGGQQLWSFAPTSYGSLM
ncbi:hypothetical protein HF086_000089, partial [Spodoptera exigua]